MSLNRLIYYSVVVGGWSAFLGWLVSEVLLQDSRVLSDLMQVALSCALVGGAIGAGLNLVAGMVNAGWKQQSKRVVTGLLTGGVGGFLGGFLGQFLHEKFGLPRAIGWTLLGAAIGTVEGLYDRSPVRLRNGLVGGAIGGLAGGLLFDPISAAFASQSGMSSRATAFVILGTCIGLLIGCIKVAMKDAWLTVIDGYRPGRQLILAEGVTLIGRAEYATLPFAGRGDDVLEPIHARVIRQPDGQYMVEDNQSRAGTSVNQVRVNGRTPLKDGDLLKVGSNSIKFHEKVRREGAAADGPAPKATTLPPLPNAGGAGPRGAPPLPGASTRPAAPPLPSTPRQPAAPAVPAPPVTPPRPAARPDPRQAPSPVPSAPPRQTPAPAPPAPLQPAPPVPTTQTPPAQAPAAAGTCALCPRKVVKGQKFCMVHLDGG